VPAALLEIRNLCTTFGIRGEELPVVDGVSLRVAPGKTVALVGESGCGKSVTALSILGLLPSNARVAGGSILFNPASAPAPPTRGGATRIQNHEPCVDLRQLDDSAMRCIRGRHIAMIFQEPMTALNPVFSVGEQIVEVVELHQGLRGRAAREAAIESLREVGIPDAARRAGDYPHQFSGGMRQRVMIAMALAGGPALLIADEPTTALDVTVQQQILDLLESLQRDRGMGVLLITHDLAVVAQTADRVYVMYAGRIVEHGPVRELLDNPLHPYTRGLLRCTPRLEDRAARWETIPGSVPDAAHPVSGCRFHPRCDVTADRARSGTRVTLPVKSESGPAVLRRCVEEFDAEPSGIPSLRELRPNHFAACWEADAAS